MRVGDFNGDGIDDMFAQAESSNTGAQRLLIMAASSPVDVITGVANGYGANTAVTYTPA